MPPVDSAPANPVPVMTARYPWHESVWSTLTPQLDRLPHALLLHGRPGLGKQAFAIQMAQTLLCAAPVSGLACGQCQSCRLFAAANHPDFSFVGRLDEAKVIAVDQIRALNDFFSLRPHTAARKVAVISPADAMNPNAANSLLKLLEEPPLGSMLLLVTSHPARLLATLRSRCSHVLFKTPTPESGMAWLQQQGGGKDAPTPRFLALAGGAPLLAKALIEEGYPDVHAQHLKDLDDLRSGRENPSTCAARWKSAGARRGLSLIYEHVSGLIKTGLLTTASSAEHSVPGNKKYKYEISELYEFIDVIHDSYRLLGGPLDELLMLENVLIRWARLGHLH